MSVSEKLQDILQAKSEILSAIEARHPAIPPTGVLHNWPRSIESICPTEKDVNFYNYDGKLLMSYDKDTAYAMSEMPTPSTIEQGMTFQGWNHTLYEMNRSIGQVGRCDIGAIMATDDDVTRIGVTLNGKLDCDLSIAFWQEFGYGLYINFNENGGMYEMYEGNMLTVSHRYNPDSFPAQYTITISQRVDCKLAFPKNIVGLTSVNDNQTTRAIARTSVIDYVKLGNNVSCISANAFKGCNNLSSINLPLSLGGDIGLSAFGGCTSLNYIGFPSGIRKIQDSAFNGCTKMKNVSFSTNIEYVGKTAFSNSGLNRFILIGNGWDDISAGLTAFGNCNSLETIGIGFSMPAIPNYFATNSKNLREIILDDDYVLSVGTYAFSNCESLRRVVLPTDLKYLGSYAFQNCKSLKLIEFPPTIQTIQGGAFSNCYGLATFDFRKCLSVPTLVQYSAFSATPADREIIVPDDLYSQWRAANQWNTTTYSVQGSIVRASDSSLGPLT